MKFHDFLKRKDYVYISKNIGVKLYIYIYIYIYIIYKQIKYIKMQSPLLVSILPIY